MDVRLDVLPFRCPAYSWFSSGNATCTASSGDVKSRLLINGYKLQYFTVTNPSQDARTHAPSIRPSIQGYLESQIMWEYAKSSENLIRCSVKNSRVFFFPRHGVPQVFVLAPLLFNIYLEAYSLILCYHGEFFRFTLMTPASPSLLSEKPRPSTSHHSHFTPRYYSAAPLREFWRAFTHIWQFNTIGLFKSYLTPLNIFMVHSRLLPLSLLRQQHWSEDRWHRWD